jgi:serine/threonine protein phosphatase PrpC
MPGTAGPASAVCSACGGPVGATDSFCEACGTELAPLTVSDGESGPPGTCEFCPSSRISADGYCESCGRKARSGRDHQEADLQMVAGVTDRGLRHHRNEDAMALATANTASGPAVLAVVCDGVSSSAHPDEASLAAARAAASVLLTAIRTGEDPLTASAAAVRAATEAVAGIVASAGLTGPAGPPGDPPSATFVSAVLTGEAATVCWLGDSRAYWLATGPDSAAQQITRDDSVVEEMVAAGLLSEADALTSAQAHVVTRWIGADASDPAPHVVRFEPPGPGALLLCSDGLWNYQPSAAMLADQALPGALTDPLGAARTLVSFALDAGGMDNVTVVLAPFPPVQPASPGLPSQPAGLT